jgi:Tfp pilus assembly protein PilE
MTQRRGITFLELLVAVVMLVALLAVLAQILAVVAGQRRHAARRLLAVEEVANVMERVAALHFKQLETEQLDGISLSAKAAESLPEAQLTVEVTPDQTGPSSAKRVTVELIWKNRAGQTNRPVRLTAWRYPDGVAGASPENAPD